MSRRLVLCIAFSGFVGLVPILGGAAAGRPACLVSNERTGEGSRSLQDGIAAAASGDTLVIKGTCVGPTTVSKNLTLRGVSNKPFGPATLDGGQQGIVVTISGADVAIGGLTIRNGANYSNGYDAGGISVAADATLALDRSTVTENDSFANGAGVSNRGSATLTNSTVSGNTGGVSKGGGIWNAPGAVLSLSRSTITGNRTFRSGGGIENEGTATVTDSTVSGNLALGGGGLSLDAGSITRIERSTVNHNEGAFSGGGIASNGSLTLVDSIVTDNNGGMVGGGIFGTAAFASGNTIAGNTPDNCYPPGGVPGCV